MWFNNLCLIWTLLLGILHVTNSAYIRCYRGSLDNYDVAPLELAETLLLSSCYNSTLNNTIYTFGYSGKVYGPATTAMLNALFKLNDRNVFLFDWQEEASSIEFLGNIGRMVWYVTSALPKAVFTGKSLAQALFRMSMKGFNLNRTHLIGHSLGAHVFGYAGRNLISLGKILDRITGLDPAGPFFDKPRIFSPLGSDCALFVDSIHTDPGGYGLNSSFATVDIFVNYINFLKRESADQVQNGCPVGNFDMFTDEDLCSHNRVWMLQIGAWNHEELLASKAPNYYAWEAGHPTEVISLGDDIDRNAKGNYYMTTNAQPPFGKGEKGLLP